MGTHSLCIAIGPLYGKPHSGRKRRLASGSPLLVPVSSTFDIRVGVYTNRVRERRRRRRNKMLQQPTATSRDRSR